MMRYLTLLQVLELHEQIIQQSGGGIGIRDLGLLESAIAQPLMTFDGEELYCSTVEKAGALGFFIIMNHPFIDGNKRTGHAAMEVLLILNGMEISSPVDEQEQVILSVASGGMRREAFLQWLQQNTTTSQSFQS